MRRDRSQLRRYVARLVVDRGVETQFVDEERTLRRTTGDTDDASGTQQARNLPGQRPNGTRGTGHHDRLATRDPRHVFHPHVRRETRGDAEGAEERRGRSKSRVDLRAHGRRQDRVLLRTQRPRHNVANG